MSFSTGLAAAAGIPFAANSRKQLPSSLHLDATLTNIREPLYSGSWAGSVTATFYYYNAKDDKGRPYESSFYVPTSTGAVWSGARKGDRLHILRENGSTLIEIIHSRKLFWLLPLGERVVHSFRQTDREREACFI